MVVPVATDVPSRVKILVVGQALSQQFSSILVPTRSPLEPVDLAMRNQKGPMEFSVPSPHLPVGTVVVTTRVFIIRPFLEVLVAVVETQRQHLLERLEPHNKGLVAEMV